MSGQLTRWMAPAILSRGMNSSVPCLACYMMAIQWLLDYKPLSDEAVIAHHGKGRVILPAMERGGNAIFAQDKKLDEMRGNMNAMGFPIDIRDRVREKLKTLKAAFMSALPGGSHEYCLSTSDYLMHSKLTYWDSVPVVMVMQALGHHVRLAPAACLSAGR